VIPWEPTERGNVHVAADTADFYRYFDATPHAEFLYGCVERTITQDLPDEAAFLRRYDAFRSAVSAIVDMPDRTIDLLCRMLRQNGGRLSKRAREREFDGLTDAEVGRVEEVYAETFGEPATRRAD
jgi:hypothetical protein